MPASTLVFECWLAILPLLTLGGKLLELPAWQPALGRFAFNITVTQPAAQKYFNVGVLLLYNFDQYNAQSFFEAGVEIDPTCAMCFWGLAYSHGPYLNRPIKNVDSLRAGLAAAQNASALLAARPAAYSRKERALIDTMLLRYPEHPEQEEQIDTYKKYSVRLKGIREGDPDDLGADADLMAFDADARMVLKCDADGYHFYTSNGDYKRPTAANGTREITALLQRALTVTNGSHPFAQHLLIHSTEMSNAQAEEVVPVARHLVNQMKLLQNQHLQHMSSHTLFRAGYYHEAVESNELAVSSDAAYLHHGLVSYGPGHNCAFLVCAAMWGGERRNAYHYAQVLQGIYRAAPGRGDGPDGSMAWSYPMLVAVRFGDWHLVHKQDVAPPGNFSLQWPYGYSVLRHFSLVAASVHLGNMTGAARHLALLQAQIPIVEASQNKYWPNLTAIANLTASAIFAHASGEFHRSSQALRSAVEIEMGMKYDEPPTWLLPSRECYGKVLMDAGLLIEAEKVFRESLYGYSFHAEPSCGWALYGLRESLQQQQKHTPTSDRAKEIGRLSAEISRVWQHSDIPLTSSCLHVATQKDSFVI